MIFLQAMLTRHSGHKCSESSSLIDWAKGMIDYTISSSLQREEGLKKAILGIESTLSQLEKNSEVKQFRSSL